MDNPERVTYFAATDSRGKRIPFGIKAKDRPRHMYVIGKTGMGKSTLLENMAIQDIRNGEGVAFIDPHGGTADKLLEYIPKNRLNDVVYFAPFDLDQPIAFNVMEDVGYDKRHLVVSGLMATFKKIWEDAWSARMEYILSNTLLALLEYPGATLLGVNRMYTDKGYRKRVVENIKDPVVRDFWVKEFAQYTDRYTQEATPAIQNKIGQFTSNPLIRNIIGQPKSSFDIRTMMDEKKILIMNLSKGQVGETNMRLLGSMLTTRIYLGAMSRADLDAGELSRKSNFYFYVDEFQNFANETFAEILSEARKYKLNLIIAHQYVEQMEEQVRAAVFGNVGTTVAFRVGPFDAETLETIFMPEFTKDDLVNLGLRQIYLTLMIDGVGSRPFSAVTIPPIEPPPITYKKEVIEASRKSFGAMRNTIEDLIYKELAVSDQEAEYIEKEPKAPARRPTSGGGNTGGTDRQRPRSQSSAPSQPRSENSSERSNDQSRSRNQRAPAPATKTAEDLKEILRTMTASTRKPEAQPGSSRQPQGNRSNDPPLKNVLADVSRKPNPVQQRAQEKSEALQSAIGGAQQDRPSLEPFEVPEDKLRAIFQEP